MSIFIIKSKYLEIKKNKKGEENIHDIFKTHEFILYVSS